MGIHYEPESPTTEEKWARLEEQAATALSHRARVATDSSYATGSRHRSP